MTAHRCAGGLKKFDLRSGSHATDISQGSLTFQSKHRYWPSNRPQFSRLIRHAWRYGGQFSTPPSLPSPGGSTKFKHGWFIWRDRLQRKRGEVNWFFNVTINNISVIHVTAHRCAPVGTWGLKSRMCPPYPHACRKRRLKWGAVI